MIGGTTNDAKGSGIQRVEVSIDGGNFNSATGTISWEFTSFTLGELHYGFGRHRDWYRGKME